MMKQELNGNTKLALVDADKSEKPPFFSKVTSLMNGESFYRNKTMMCDTIHRLLPLSLLYMYTQNYPKISTFSIFLMEQTYFPNNKNNIF